MPGVAVQPCGPNLSFDWVGIDNGFFGFVGTNASSPDIAGLMALKIEFLGSRLGNENFEIYAMSWLTQAHIVTASIDPGRSRRNLSHSQEGCLGEIEDAR